MVIASGPGPNQAECTLGASLYNRTVGFQKSYVIMINETLTCVLFLFCYNLSFTINMFGLLIVILLN